MTNSKSEMKWQKVQMTSEELWVKLELCESREDELKLLDEWRDSEIARAPQWISVEDKLPDENRDYLCAFDDGTIETYPFDAVEHLCIWGSNSGRFGVTHWMELPEPPK